MVEVSEEAAMSQLGVAEQVAASLDNGRSSTR
jgi:hypothetical protein